MKEKLECTSSHKQLNKIGEHCTTKTYSSFINYIITLTYLLISIKRNTKIYILMFLVLGLQNS